MPKEEPGNNSDNTPKKSASVSDGLASHSVPPHGSEESVTGTNTEYQGHSRNKPQTINIGKIPKIDVIEGVEANKIAKSANNISRWSVVVSALLFGITLLIAYQAIKQSKAASDSVALARQTYLADSTYKHKNDSLFKKSDNIKKAREDSVFNAQKDFYNNAKNGVDAQIKSLKDNERFFEDSHSPIMDITNYSINKDNPKIIEITVHNDGTQTAEIIEDDVKIKADTPNGSYQYIQKLIAKIGRSQGNLLGLLAPGKTMNFMVPLDSISNSDFESFNKGVKDLYIRVNVYYFNPLTKNIWKLDQVTEFKKNGTCATFSINNTFVEKAK